MTCSGRRKGSSRPSADRARSGRAPSDQPEGPCISAMDMWLGYHSPPRRPNQSDRSHRGPRLYFRHLPPALPVLQRLRYLGELQHLTGQVTKLLQGLHRRRVEELPAEVHLIHPSLCEPTVHLGLDADGVVGEEERVDVEPERYRGVAELAHAIHRFQARSEERRVGTEGEPGW